MPSVLFPGYSVLVSSLCVELGGNIWGRTVCYHEEIDSQNGKAFSDSVVGVLELALHDGCVDLNDNDSAQAG